MRPLPQHGKPTVAPLFILGSWTTAIDLRPRVARRRCHSFGRPWVADHRREPDGTVVAEDEDWRPHRLAAVKADISENLSYGELTLPAWRCA